MNSMVPVQLDLPLNSARLDSGQLMALLNEPPKGGAKPVAVQVVLTRNLVSMISVRRHPAGFVQVRLHEAFLAAPKETLLSLRRFIRTRDRGAWRAIAAFARTIAVPDSPRPAPAPTRAAARGRVYDLEPIRKDVNHDFFGSEVECSIAWSRGSSPRTARLHSVRLGSWCSARRLIRIHPCLDQPRVPLFFVSFIVFHEMLHAVVPYEQRGSQTVVHTPRFRALERNHPDYAAARAYMKNRLFQC